MDFFEAQERAKKRTTRLVILFTLAVLGTILAGYVAAVLVLHQLAGAQTDPYSPVEYEVLRWWQPQLLLLIAVGTVVVVGLASLSKWFALRAGGPAVAEMLGARRVAAQTTEPRERQLLNVVEEMAIASGTPLPAVYVLDQEPGLNAFAAGLTTSDAAVAVTRGTLEKLSRDELQGVIAHEFSHILNGDMRLNLKLTSVVFGILVIALIGQGLVRSLRFAHLAGAGGRGRRNQGGGVMALIVIGLALMAVGYIGYFFGRLIQAAVSRQREYLADAAAVQFTRYPGGIAGALKKIGGFALGGRLITPAAAQINHAFFAQNFKSGLTGLFSTHPPLPVRIQAIEPGFDGKFFEPPQVVDVGRESFRTAGFGPAQAARLHEEPPPIPPAPPRVAIAPAALAASIGLPGPSHVARARQLLASLPAALTEAAHDTSDAVALVYALLLEVPESLRAHQLTQIRKFDRTALAATERLAPDALALPRVARLPLLQLALEPLSRLDDARRTGFLATVDALVQADPEVTTFEYTLRRLLQHHLELVQHPSQAGEQIFSFSAVTPQIVTVLSTLAHASAGDDSVARHAFAAGMNELRIIESAPAMLPRDAGTLPALDEALNRLAHASLPIKKRLLHAACHVVAADGTVGEAEAELLRAISAALDAPIPPLFDPSAPSTSGT